MRAVIFANGVIADYTKVAARVRAADYLICADGGTRHCLALGRTPQVVVGDLDSLEPALAASLEAQGVQIERHAVAKAQTDLELAIERALRDGADEVVLLGALGGRLDQTLANLLILAQREWPVPISVIEANEIAWVIRGGETHMISGKPGSTISLIPLSPVVTGITYHGLEYPLIDHTLHFGSTRAISNVLVESPATVTIAAGLALLVQEEAGSI
jgi:thiamine pyrophosphokinase